MKFKLDGVRSAVMAALAVAVLASCGGGTQVEAFEPRRVIVFGDESSLIVSATEAGDAAHPGQGRKYTVNGVEFFTDTSVSPSVSIPVTPTNPKCAANPIWVQVLASSYGFAFDECADSGTVGKQKMNAKLNARAADLSQQVSDFLVGTDGGPFTGNDLVTVMMGMNDVIQLYKGDGSPTTNSAALIAAARQAGNEIGAQVVRITDLGAKVIVSTIPDMGRSPFAVKEEVTNPGAAALLSRLSSELNTQLRIKLQDVRDGGRAAGLVLGDEVVLTMINFPSTYGLTNITEAACTNTTTTALQCDQTTTADSAQPPTGSTITLTYGNAWLWADDTHLGAAAQSRLGSAAQSRARSNPF